MLDPRIPMMGLAPREPQSPLTLMKDIVGTREALAKAQEAERQRQEMEQIRKVYGEVGIDPANRAELYRRLAPINPLIAEKVRAEDEQLGLDRDKVNLEKLRVGIGTFKESVPFIRAAAFALSRPETYADGRQMALTLGKVLGQFMPQIADYAAKIPEQYNEQAAAMVAQIPQWLDRESKSLDEVERGVLIREQELGRPLTWREYAETVQIIQGRAQQSEVSWQSDEMMVPDGKGGLKKINVWKNPKTRQIVDAAGNDVSSLAEPPPAAQTTDTAVIKEAAKNIVNSPRDLTSIRNITSLRGDQRMLLYNAVKELDPTFDLGMIDRRVQFINQYEDPKGRARINRDSINNILMHAADLSRVNKEYSRTDARLLNVPLNALARQYSPVYTAYMVPLSVLRDEIALYFAGGYAPHERQMEAWNKIADETATPEQIERFVRDLIHVGLRRADTFNEAFKKNMGYDDPNLLTPEAVKAAEDLGMGQEVKKFGSGGTLAISERQTGMPSGPVKYGVIDPRDNQWKPVRDKAAMDAAVQESSGAFVAAPRPLESPAKPAAAGTTTSSDNIPTAMPPMKDRVAGKTKWRSPTGIVTWDGKVWK